MKIDVCIECSKCKLKSGLLSNEFKNDLGFLSLEYTCIVCDNIWIIETEELFEIYDEDPNAYEGDSTQAEEDIEEDIKEEDIEDTEEEDD